VAGKLAGGEGAAPRPQDADRQDRNFVPVVLAGASDVVPGLYRKLILAQRVSTAGVPEPLLGPIVGKPVLVAGLNPYHRAPADRPRLGCPFEEYRRYFARMFSPNQRNELGPFVKPELDGLFREVGHFIEVEDALAPALGQAALGRAAMYADAIPWKAATPPKIDRELQAAMGERITRIVESL
jgi:hypothetical protein